MLVDPQIGGRRPRPGGPRWGRHLPRPRPARRLPHRLGGRGPPSRHRACSPDRAVDHRRPRRARVSERVGVGRLPGYPGVWVGLDEERARRPGGVGPRKVCAIGVRTARGRTTHGFAAQRRIPTSPSSSHIVPCGIADRPVTSLAAEGWHGTMADVVDGHRRGWPGGSGTPTPISRRSLTERRPATRWRSTPSRTGQRCRASPSGSFARRRGRGASATPAVGHRPRAPVGPLGRGSRHGLALVERKPDWLRVPARMGDEFLHLRQGLRARELVTVCEEAGCPEHLRVLVGGHGHLHDQRRSLYPRPVASARSPRSAPDRSTQPSPNGWPRPRPRWALPMPS